VNPKVSVTAAVGRAAGRIVDSFDAGPQAATMLREGQASQLRQIADGMRSGSITAKEAETLLKQQKQIADSSQSAMANGKMTLGEFKNLVAQQRQASANILLAGRNSESTLPSRPSLFNPSTTTSQAAQLDRLATGRNSGNITGSELSKLLGQQVQIADGRGDADTTKESSEVRTALNQASKDITRHSKEGTQISFAGVGIAVAKKG
jgi:hypothetical protein